MISAVKLMFKTYQYNKLNFLFSKFGKSFSIKRRKNGEKQHFT